MHKNGKMQQSVRSEVTKLHSARPADREISFPFARAKCIQEREAILKAVLAHSSPAQPPLKSMPAAQPYPNHTFNYLCNCRAHDESHEWSSSPVSPGSSSARRHISLRMHSDRSPSFALHLFRHRSGSHRA